ncbi:ATP-binding protein [Thalassotalea sp. Y01]|uniref:ATP-binding protein n=1 Tax=Thalassotalea sp. Y01 TaxID=2729613 RepID=UPI00145CF047|nr:ATP-binding protein [Thalassotalea sp. Y01]NMP14843.1 GHKL domain-containing protein [Thalassotalea sp. Y01]
MNKQFLRLTLFLVASLIILALSLQLVWESVEPSETVISVDDFYHSSIERKGDIFTMVPLNTISLPTDMLEPLKSGEIIRVDDEQDNAYYYKLHNNAVLILGPIVDDDQGQGSHQLVTTLFYAGCGLIILFWFRPAFVDLRKLSTSVMAFSKNAKWQHLHLKPTSIAYPAANTINQMAERIEQLIDLQKNLSRMVGHEIRTPLARTGFSIASLKHEPSLDELLSIEEDLQEIEDLTEEFLQITKLEFDSKDIVLVKQNVYAPIEDLVNKLQKASRINIVVDMDNNVTAPVETKTFKRLMQNLITNALKHANEQVEIRFSQVNDQFTISVSDDGGGFEQTQQLDKPFYQGNPKVDGYGLGLSIVKMIAAWYQGDIQFTQSNSLNGAKVSFTWPIDKD